MFFARSIRRLTALMLAAGAAAALGGAAAAAEAPDAPALTLRALTGPKGGTLDVRAATQELDHVHVQLYAPDTPEDAEPETLDFKHVELDDSAATLPLGTVERGTRLAVMAQSRVGNRTVVSRGAAVARLRPDIVVTAVDAPPQTLSVTPVDVSVEIEELNGETGATVEVALVLGQIPISEAQQVAVAAGKTAVVVFEDVVLAEATTTELTARVQKASTFETDEDNNERRATIEVTEHELVRANVLVPSLGGYGLQFNHHVYAPITPWPHDSTPDDDYDDFEAKTIALQPHIVRVFYNDNWEENKDGMHPEWRENYASFVKVVTLAHEAGAVVDVSYQTLFNVRRTPVASMTKFADVLEELVVDRGLTNVRWAEVGNEANSTGVSLAEYEVMVRALDAELIARGLDDDIGLMGPGLLELAGNATRNHYEWSKALATTMGDVFDAWGEHVYWNYNDAGRLEYRLRDIWHLMNEVLPPEQRKPVYLMEFGIRGLGACGTKPASGNTYYAADPACPEIWRTNIAGFQQLWFAIGSAQLGFAGAAKWDAFWGRYDTTVNPPQVYWTVGPPAEGSPLTPSYYAMELLFHTTRPGWQVVQVSPWDESDWTVPTYGIEGHSSNDTPEKEIAAYTGPNGELTVLGLDTNGRALNVAAGSALVRYSIGELPPNTNLNLAIWNAAGDGTTAKGRTVGTNAAGVARFEVPLHAAFSLTTVPIS
jgi:hypothetical protein